MLPPSLRNMTPVPDRAAPLVYVMGPSGAGKDTLLAYARARLDPTCILFAHRYITRPVTAGDENHVALTAAEFAMRRAAGLFTLSWESHGHAYGIGVEIELWRKRGLLVVVSGARAAWPTARERYPDAVGVLVDAPADLRAARLASRGREDAAAIRARLEREVGVAWDGTVHRLDNSGPVAQAGDALVRLLDAAAKDASHR